MGELPNPVAATVAWVGAAADAHRWTPVVAAAITAAGAAVLLVDPSALRIVAGALLIVLGAVPEACSAWWRDQEEASQGNALADQVLITKTALRPLAEWTAEMIYSRDPSERERLWGRITQHAVGACVLIHPNEAGLRAVVFALSDDLKRMSPIAHSGRDDVPGDFIAGTARGDQAFRVLNTRKTWLVRDLQKHRPKIWGGSGHGYRSFISTPISDQGGAYGMLTIDAAVPGTLTKGDQYFAELVAAMLACAFADRDVRTQLTAGASSSTRGE